MTKIPPLVVSGSIAIDRIMKFDGTYQDHIRPEKLSSLSISIFLSALEDSHGGVGANIAYSLAMLGASPILVGSVGPDSQAYMDKLSEVGVDTHFVHQSSLPTASFNVITDRDENQVGGFYPGAMFDSESLSFETWCDDNPIVVVSPHDPTAMRRQVEQCKAWKLRLCYDVGQQVSNLDRDDLLEGLEAADILILNDYEMAALAAKVGRDVASIKKQVPIVVTTKGREGSIIEGSTIREAIVVHAAKVQDAVDPTGAGDAYRAGFLFGLSRGWDLRKSAQLGATCGAYAVEQSGTQNHKFNTREVADRYLANFGDPIPQLS